MSDTSRVLAERTPQVGERRACWKKYESTEDVPIRDLVQVQDLAAE